MSFKLSTLREHFHLRRWDDALFFVLFAALLVHSYFAFSYGFRQPLTDFHDTRQAFTALIADGIAKGGPLFAYWVPLLGPPWSMPHEFPIFEWAVVLIRGLTRLPLDSAGRLTNILFFYLCFIPIFHIQELCGI